jgi:hypothetical protein
LRFGADLKEFVDHLGVDKVEPTAIFTGENSNHVAS